MPRVRSPIKGDLYRGSLLNFWCVRPGPEISDPLFRTDSLQIHPHSLPEKIEVLFLGEPFREIGGFVLPNGSEIVDFFEFSEEA